MKMLKRGLKLSRSAIITLKREGIRSFFRKTLKYLDIRRTELFQDRKFYFAALRKGIRPKIDENDFQVLIISEGGEEKGTTRYRAFHKKRQLNLYGIRCKVAPYIIPTDILNHDLIILHRIAYDDRVKRLFDRIRQLKKIAIFDVDDLIFKPDLIPWIRSICSEWPQEEADSFCNQIEKYSQTLERCDYVLTSTDFLSRLIEKRGKKVFIIRNSLSDELIDISEHVSNPRKRSKKEIVLGYLSGTTTHKRDFGEITDALLYILKKYNRVYLHIAGHLTLNEAFTKFKDRIKQTLFVPWKKLPSIISSLDINLAPLEVNNPFCQAKSELKYFEAAICGIPTVASKTDSYQYAITPGVNGFLASTTKEWRENLELLINDKRLRNRIGQKAKEDVLLRYSPLNRGKELVETLKMIIRDRNKNILKMARSEKR